MMPKLLYSRLDEIGVDFAVVYPTAGLRLPRIKDDEVSRAVIRAYNIVSAEYFDGLGDRLTPAAIIPMHSPRGGDRRTRIRDQAARLEGRHVRQRHVAPAPEPTGNATVHYDVLAIDSQYDYDPVWAKCVELGIAPTFHSSASGQGLRNSPSNFVYNHIGHFAAAGHAVSKAIFLGGVTRRFPELRFAFLEGGVGWAAQLWGDLMEHWERRGAPALERMKPEKLDRKLLMDLVKKHGYDDIAEALRARDGWPSPDTQDLTGNRAELTISPPARSPARRIGSICLQSRSISAARPTTA